MFCPSCGAKNSSEQRFCRSCGMNLELAARSLVEQFPAGERPDLERREQVLERFGNVVFGGFGIILLVAVGGIIYTIFTRFVLDGSQPWVGIFMIAFVIFAAMALVYVGFAEDLKEKRKRAASTPARDLGEARETGRLIGEKEFIPVPIVTEHTTDLLPQDRDRTS